MNSEWSIPYFLTLIQFVSPVILLRIVSLLNRHVVKTEWLPSFS